MGDQRLPSRENDGEIRVDIGGSQSPAKRTIYTEFVACGKNNGSKYAIQRYGITNDITDESP